MKFPRPKSLLGKSFGGKYIDREAGCGFGDFICLLNNTLCEFVQGVDMKVGESGNDRCGIVLSSSNYLQDHL